MLCSNVVASVCCSFIGTASVIYGTRNYTIIVYLCYGFAGDRSHLWSDESRKRIFGVFTAWERGWWLKMFSPSGGRGLTALPQIP